MEQTRTQCCLPQVLSFIAGGALPFCSLVIRLLREALGPTKTISFTKFRPFYIGSYDEVVDTVIAAAHHYLDYITGDLNLLHNTAYTKMLTCIFASAQDMLFLKRQDIYLH